MSRITVDLKKHAFGRVHYDLSRHAVVDDEDGPYCYQLSQIRFRSIIHGGGNLPKPGATPHESDLKDSGNSNGDIDTSGRATGDKVHNIDVVAGSGSV